MKTLKQIREETRSRVHISGDEESLLEAKIGEKYASLSDMPMILVFKRRSYRIYPDKQTVALYYNSLTDKYLSIPFGPKGNLNLSEAQEVELDEFAPLAAAGTLAKSAVKGAASWALNKAKNALAGGNAASSGSSASTPVEPTYKRADKFKKLQAKSGFDRQTTTSDATLRAKMKAADLKNIKESNITILKKMVKENIQSQEILIGDKPLTVSNIMAKKITEVYDSVNRQNKKQIETMLNESVDSFKNLLNFSLKN